MNHNNRIPKEEIDRLNAMTEAERQAYFDKQDQVARELSNTMQRLRQETNS